MPSFDGRRELLWTQTPLGPCPVRRTREISDCAKSHTASQAPVLSPAIARVATLGVQ
jgi:hypothetical protein